MNTMNNNDFWITDTFDKTFLSNLDAVDVVMTIESDTPLKEFTTPAGKKVELSPDQQEKLCWIWLALTGTWQVFQGSYHRAMASIHEDGCMSDWVEELEQCLIDKEIEDDSTEDMVKENNNERGN